MKPLVALCIVGFLNSCDTATEQLSEIEAETQELTWESNTSKFKEESSAGQEKIRYTLEVASKVVAQLMHNEEFRVLLKEKAQLKFDGDYDVLYSSIRANARKKIVLV
ncbi:MAG: hypothetical protein COZ18_14225 [Flexibacter sp. CG_4_10_14_3_um_filter_32_15]|nr:MAG: hypothetical protein COZ18_14225 [Flexibacter sp. CG_4_10_14_3_um_filter_32_15]